MSTTVEGTIKNKGEVVLQKRTITFKCTDGASILGAALAIPDPDITGTTDVSGNFSKVLAPGNYEIWLGSEKYCTIAVPTGSSTVRLEDISDLSPTVDISTFDSILMRADDGALVRLKIGVADGGGYTSYVIPA